MIPEADSALALFLAASWRGSVLIAVLLGLRLVLRKQVSPGIFAAAWALLALMFLVPLSWSTAWSPFAWTRPVAIAAAMTERDAGGDGIVVRANVSPAPRALPVGESRPQVSPAVDAPRPSGRMQLASVVWLSVAAALLALRAMVALYWGIRLRREAVPVDARVLAAWQQTTMESGLARPPRLVMTDLVATPALCGLVGSRVLFPRTLGGQLSEAELRWILRHELGHHRRRDLWTLALWQVAAAVHWFNPLAWLALRVARHDCELACDATVLRRVSPGEWMDYGQALLKVLGASSRPHRPPVGVGIFETKRQLRRRLIMIVHYRRAGLGRIIAGLLLLVGIAAAGYTQKASATVDGAAPQPVATKMVPPVMQLRAADPAPSLPPAERDRIRAELRLKEDEWAASVHYELRAVGLVGGVPVAMVDVNGDPNFVSVNSSLMDYRVSEIDVAAGSLVLQDRYGNTRFLPLVKPRAIEFPEVRPESFLSAEYQASLMERGHSSMLPSEVSMAWPKINREGKEAILLNYLRRAQLVVCIPTPTGGSTGGVNFLFREKLSALNRERREAFLASLTREQLAEYGNGASPAINLRSSPAEREAQVAAAREAEARREKVEAELTPEQRVLFEAWRGRSRSRVQGR